MFYQDEMDEALRFGDVVKGFVSVVPQINAPLFDSEEPEYSISIAATRFSVVLTPCCSIQRETISLSPLLPLRSAFFDNQYFVEDFTRINRAVPPEFALPANKWERLPEGERQKRLAIGETYTFAELFVYESHPLLPPYTLSRKSGQIETDDYMVDFAGIYRVNCDKIKRGAPPPTNAKCLQLSIETRKELRDKLSDYYGRIPEEDVELLSG